MTQSLTGSWMKEITAGYAPPASEETGIRYPCPRRVLRKRIAEVRNWVQNLDYEHRISFLVPDP
jgi:hypothetical protein